MKLKLPTRILTTYRITNSHDSCASFRGIFSVSSFFVVIVFDMFAQCLVIGNVDRMSEFPYFFPKHPDSFQEMLDKFMKKNAKGNTAKREGFVKFSTKKRRDALRDLHIIKMKIDRYDQYWIRIQKILNYMQLGLFPFNYPQRDADMENYFHSKFRLKFIEDESYLNLYIASLINVSSCLANNKYVFCNFFLQIMNYPDVYQIDDIPIAGCKLLLLDPFKEQDERKFRIISQCVLDIIRANRIEKCVLGAIMNELNVSEDTLFQNDENPSAISWTMFRQLMGLMNPDKSRDGFDYLFSLVGDEEYISAKEEVPFFVCSGQCVDTILTDLEAVCRTDDHDVRFKECDCKTYIDGISGGVANLHLERPDVLLYLVGLFLSHTSESHFDVAKRFNLIATAAPGNQPTHFKFRLRDAFLNINPIEDPIEKILISLSAFCSLLSFTNMFERPKSLSYSAVNILISFVQYLVYQALTKNKLTADEETTPLTPPLFKFEKLMSSMTFYNILSPLIRLFCEMKSDAAEPPANRKISLLRYIHANLIYPPQNLENVHHIQSLIRSINRPKEKYFMFGWIDENGKIISKGTDYMMAVRKYFNSNRGLDVNRMHQCENIWIAMRNRGNSCFSLNDSNVDESNYLGLLTGHLLKIMRSQNYDSHTSRIKAFWMMRNVSRKAVDNKSVFKSTPLQYEDVLSGDIVALLMLLKTNTITNLSHIELMAIECLLASNASEESILYLEEIFIILLISLINVIREVAKDESVLISTIAQCYDAGSVDRQSNDAIPINPIEIKKQLSFKVKLASDNLGKEYNVSSLIQGCRKISLTDQEVGTCLRFCTILNDSFEAVGNEMTDMTKMC